MSYLSFIRSSGIFLKNPIRFGLNRSLSLTALKLNEQHTAQDFKAEEESKKADNTKWTQSEEKLQENILKNAMKYVPIHGFSVQALIEASTEAGLSPAAHSIFKNGAFDLINYFYKSSNKELEVYLENYIKERQNKVNITELIREAIVYRLKLLHPYIDKWPEAMAIMSFNPSYAIESIQNLLELCDEIWHKAGDKSTDLNWYTKRLTLAVIYKSTELFMIQDKSENFNETWKFLDRRFEDLRSYGQFQKSINNTQQLINGSFSVLKNILNIRT